MYEGYEDIHRVGWGKEVNFYEAQRNHSDGLYCVVHICTSRMTIVARGLSEHEAELAAKQLNDASMTTRKPR